MNKTLRSLLILLIGFAMGFTASQFLPQKTASPDQTMHAAEKSAAPHTNAVCLSVVQHALGVATKGNFLSETDCTGEKIGSAWLLPSSTDTDAVSLRADVIVPVDSWQPENVTSFMIPQLAHSASFSQAKESQTNADSAAMLCKKTSLALKLGLKGNSVPVSDQINQLRQNSQRVLNVFAASLDLSSAGNIPNQIETLISNFSGFRKKFGDYAIGSIYNSHDQTMLAYVLTDDRNKCQSIFQDEFFQSLIKSLPLLPKKPTQKMTLVCDQEITQTFGVSAAGQYGDPCVTSLLSLRITGSKGLSYAVTAQ